MVGENQIGAGAFDPGANAEVGQAALGRVNVSSKASVDPSAFKELNKEFAKLNTYVKDFKTTLPKLVSETKEWAKALGTVATNMGKVAKAQTKGGTGSSYLPDAGTLVGSGNTINQTQIANIYTGGASPTAGGGGGGGDQLGGKMGKFLAGVGYANDLLGPLAGALENRIARGASYSLSADRMSMMYQQMSGLTQNQAYHAYRAPLANKLLGMGGINEVLGLQATTGINARMQAQSVEALRAASGFSYSTSDINAMTRQLGSAQVNNQMFMMLGTGLYGMGGRQRSTQQVYQDVISRMGLTNERYVKGAFQQGSFQRARMEMAGLGQEQQDLILQMAQQNIAFQKKTGGRFGTYDAGNARHRQIMGVEEDQYATQFEKTQASAVSREENFYKRQNDNFAQMEKNLQAVNRALEAFEEKLSGAIGARVSSKGSMLKGFLKAGISGMVGIGAAIMSGGTAGFAAGAGTKMLLDNVIGDGPGGSGGASGGPQTSVGYTSGSAPDNVKKAESKLSKLNPKFANRLRKMMMENRNLFITDGLRMNKKETFLKRYRPAKPGESEDKYDRMFEGVRYKLKPGEAPYAPPGESMHEIGLAADLGPSSEYDWITANAAKYGLKNYPQYGGEAWHVQPSELPDGRKQYEAMGSPWGQEGMSSSASTNSDSTYATSLQSGRWGNMDMSEIIGSSSIGGYSGTSSYTPGKSANSDYSAGGPNPLPIAAGALPGTQVAQHLYNAGFRGKDLEKAVAVAYRESRFNPRSHNTQGRDNSYGLMQINMKDNDPTAPDMGKKRAIRFGIKRYEELFNPVVNTKSAYVIFSGKTASGEQLPPGGWTGWDHKSLKPEYVSAAKNYIKDAKLPSGDGGAPMRQNVTGGGGAVSTYSITVAPNITIHSQGASNMDMQKVARDVATLLEREVRMTMMRVS